METATDRLRLILGDEGLARVADATVMVLGLGGVGSSCAEALARGGTEAVSVQPARSRIRKASHGMTIRRHWGSLGT